MLSFVTENVAIDAFCTVSYMLLLDVSHHCYTNTIVLKPFIA